MTPPVPVPDPRVEWIFHAALGLDDLDAREALIDAECGGDPALAKRVRRLLVAHQDEGRPLESAPLSPEIERELARIKPEKAGDRIGAYHLIERIGEGGFGIVWLADQEHPVRRQVALKIIKMGMDTREVIARFEQERQALAIMEHPNIARVIDAGATPSGRPFFAMELVRGTKLTDYCDEHHLGTSQRLGLFIRVCHAVQHAHQKGIIHRDLKPSNILVTTNDGEPVPKVIDFGVAKATEGRLTDATLVTQLDQWIGTPAYMSPEQAALSLLDIDTRSDIYSLGVLLYELLTGRTPIDVDTLARAGRDEVRRLIREVDPPRPSARVKSLADEELTTAARCRHLEPAKLPASLRGDLDWIVMRCLEKDRNRRYETANNLALDLQRHLSHQAVSARAPSTAYLAGKLIRRHKLAVAAAALVALSLLLGLALSAWQSTRARRALAELRATAPAFIEQARALVAKEQYNDAIEKLAYAAKLRPDDPGILIAMADLFQCQLQLPEAARAYRAALILQPDNARAQAGATLTDLLLAAPRSPDGGLSRETISLLHLVMQEEQRPAAEVMPVARRLGEERHQVVAYWLARLHELPVSADRPLEERLTVRDDGRLALDLTASRITDLTPLTGMPLGSLNLEGCNLIRDFEPLGTFRSLSSLVLKDTSIVDLSPLRGLPLESLVLDGTGVFDLSALRGMSLRILNLRSTRVADLSPLAGMPISHFDATAIPATDYSPLAGAPLEECFIQSSPVRDLSFLQDSPVQRLILFNCAEARGFSVLSSLPSLNMLILPQTFRGLPDEEITAIENLRNNPTLRNIQADSRDRMGWTISITQPTEDFWRAWDREQTFLPALRKSGFRFSLTKLPDKTYLLSMRNQSISDLSILAGAPISELWISGGRVTDLRPLRGLPLRVLGLWSNTDLEDLSPLRGLPLEELSVEYTKVRDLTPLAGMPLKKAYLHKCENLIDLSPLLEITTLEKLTIPVNAHQIGSLRQLPNLEWLGFQPDQANAQFPATTVAQFWEAWPALAWKDDLTAAGTAFSAAQGADGMWEVTVSDPGFSDCSIFKNARLRSLTLEGTSVTDLAPLATLPLDTLHLRGTPVSELAPLSHLALEELRLNQVPATDLSFLRGARIAGSLKKLWLEKLRVTDFSAVAACTSLLLLSAWESPLKDLDPLRGLPITHLYLAGSEVRDLSPLAGLPLARIHCDNLSIKDVTPLLHCPTLTHVILPKAAENPEALCALPALKRISYRYDSNVRGPSMTVADFLASQRTDPAPQ